MFPLLRPLLIFISLGLLALAVPASAHPAPFSYLDLTLEKERITGSLTVHTIDLAQALDIDEPQSLLDQGVLDDQYSAINGILRSRFHLSVEGEPDLSVIFTRVEPVPGDDAVKVEFVTTGPPPAALVVDAHLFPYDPTHQTFVNIYQGGAQGRALSQQWLFDASSPPRTYFAGSVAGVAAIFETFVPSGAHHVLIGADHVLFLIGLILLGGSLRRLTIIVTAFTIGHSVTLALAALDIVTPPGWLIEPLIALSIVIVGADNLMRGEGRDLRAVFAATFGLIHGFGFAYVLREFGLPQANLAWSLLSFNIGVELGQLAIVVPVALALAALRKRWPLVAKRIAMAGSLAVILAGAYWFVDRVQMIGSG